MLDIGLGIVIASVAGLMVLTIWLLRNSTRTDARRKNRCRDDAADSLKALGTENVEHEPRPARKRPRPSTFGWSLQWFRWRN